MRFLDFLRAEKKSNSPQYDVSTCRGIVQNILEEIKARKRDVYSHFSAYGSLETFRSLNQRPREFTISFLYFLFDEVIRSWEQSRKNLINSWDTTYHHG